MYGKDQIVGKLMLTVVFVSLIYYFLWVAILPFVRDEKIIEIFPNQLYAVIAPAVFFSIVLGTTASYLCYSFINYSHNSS